MLQIRAPVRHGVVTYSEMYEQLSMLATDLPTVRDPLQMLPSSPQINNLIRSGLHCYVPV